MSMERRAMFAELRRTVRRVMTSLRPQRADQELAREIDAHLALLEDDYRRRGLGADDARLAARRALGGIEQMKEAQRDSRAFRWIEDLRQDVRYALRILRRNPGVGTIAAVTLGLGIGMSTAVFSVLDAVVLRPLSYPDPQRLVWATLRDPPRQDEFVPRQLPTWREQLATFEHLASYDFFDGTLDTGGTVAPLRLALVSPDFWRIAAARTVLGRP
jgi:hypothetical protein